MKAFTCKEVGNLFLGAAKRESTQPNDCVVVRDDLVRTTALHNPVHLTLLRSEHCQHTMHGYETRHSKSKPGFVWSPLFLKRISKLTLPIFTSITCSLHCTIFHYNRLNQPIDFMGIPVRSRIFGSIVYLNGLCCCIVSSHYVCFNQPKGYIMVS